MHTKIADHTLMGRRKNSLKGPVRRVMMKAKPNIKVPVDESSAVATKVVNPTIDKVIVNESPSAAIKVDNPTTNKVGVDESPFAAIEVVNPTTERVYVNESPFATTKVVNPTTNKVLADESPSITIEVVNPTINSEGNGGGQTNLQGGPTMPRAKTTRPPVHDHIAQREELRKEKNKKHKQGSRAILAAASDKTKGLLLSTSASSGSNECSCTFSTKGTK
jgi:hypothetical protein